MNGRDLEPTHPLGAVRSGGGPEPQSPLEDLVTAMLDRRVRDLRITIRDGGIVLRGRASSYHVKQLAQHATMAVSDLPLLANEIRVTAFRDGRPDGRDAEHEPGRARARKLVLLASSNDRLRIDLWCDLTERGYSVATAASGIECIRLLREGEREPAAIVLDDELLWGGADGVVWHLRTSAGLSAPVVLLTSPGDGSLGPGTPTSAPVVSVLAKPVRLESFLRALRLAAGEPGTAV